jgi:hypothetical protein
MGNRFHDGYFSVQHLQRLFPWSSARILQQLEPARYSLALFLNLCLGNTSVDSHDQRTEIYYLWMIFTALHSPVLRSIALLTVAKLPFPI